LAEITIRGREAHSAYPPNGASAIYGSASLVRAIEDIEIQFKASECAFFDPPFTTLNVGVIAGGTAKNIIPGECRLKLEWRPIPGDDARRVIDTLNEVVQALRRARPEFSCHIEVLRYSVISRALRPVPTPAL
jgi:acetylornithine deacetylase